VEVVEVLMADLVEVVLQVLLQDLLSQNLAAVAEPVGQVAVTEDPAAEEMEQIT
jgi:hypothetical protein|tara:strand:+ start:634 stop:795 length:162 start_codon:yes stop_codon:yes gene_type:complete